MGKQIIAICGHSSEYIRKMYEYVCSNYGEDFKIILFTKENSLEEYLIDSPVDILIAEEDFEFSKEVGMGVVVILSEKPGRDGMVYKYTPCNIILKEVMAECAAKNLLKNREECGEKRIIGVYTPVKRCFQTTFALTLGQILAKSSKVLYLNFESYSGFDYLFRSAARNDLMDLLYFSECSGENLSYRIDSIKEKLGNLDYISPIKSFIKYTDISRDQWERLISNLILSTDYEVIILDLSEQVNGLLSILQKCSQIYTIIDSERIACAKVAQYENMLKVSMYGDILEKTKNISLPRFKDIPLEAEMLPYSDLAEYIKKILAFEKQEYETGFGY